MIDYEIKKYDRYLNSDEWKKIRDYEIQNHPYCSFCDKTENLQVHHCDYSFSPRLVVLCKGCHQIISDMVKEYNKTPWVEKLDNMFAPEICKSYILKIYKQQYCKNPKKRVNFLNFSHIKEVCSVFQDTLKGQYRCDGAPSDVKPLIKARLDRFYCQGRTQSAISEYRKQYAQEAIIAGEPLYAVKFYLGTNKI